MVKVMQDKNSSVNGDCLRACVASLFEMPLTEVPDFVNSFTIWFDAMWYWLRFKGYRLKYKGANPPGNQLFMDNSLHKYKGVDGYAIVTVDSMRDGYDHVCIYSIVERRIVHDPNEGSPCVKIQPPILGYYEITEVEHGV